MIKITSKKKKLIANIIVNGDTLRCLRLGTRKGGPHSHSITADVRARTVR